MANRLLLPPQRRGPPARALNDPRPPRGSFRVLGQFREARVPYNRVRPAVRLSRSAPVTDAVERLVNLAFYLADAREPVSAERIRVDVTGYPADQDAERVPAHVRARQGRAARRRLRHRHRRDGALSRSTARRPSPRPSTSRPRRPRPFAPPAPRFSTTPPSPSPTTCASRWPRSPRRSTPATSPAAARLADEDPARQGESVADARRRRRARQDASPSPTPTRAAPARRTRSSRTASSSTTAAGISVGRDIAKDEVRTYTVARMSDIEVNAARPKSPDFERPADFDVRELRSPARSSTARPPSEFEAADALRRLGGMARRVARGRAAAALERDADGVAVWRVRARDRDAAAALRRSRTAPGCALAEPPDAADALRAGLEEVARIHGLEPPRPIARGDSSRCSAGSTTGTSHRRSRRWPPSSTRRRPSSRADLETLSVCGIAPYTPMELVPVLVDGDVVEVWGSMPAMRGPVRLSACRGRALAAALAAAGFAADDPLAGQAARGRPRRLRCRGARAHAAHTPGQPRLGDVRGARRAVSRHARCSRSPTSAKAPPSRASAASSRCSSSPTAARGTSRRGAGRPARTAPSASIASAASSRPARRSTPLRAPPPRCAQRHSAAEGLPIARLLFSAGEEFSEREWPGAQRCRGARGRLARRRGAVRWHRLDRAARGRSAGRVEVLAPAEVRDAVAALAREELARL